jgi:hypothetical protein
VQAIVELGEVLGGHARADRGQQGVPVVTRPGLAMSDGSADRAEQHRGHLACGRLGDVVTERPVADRIEVGPGRDTGIGVGCERGEHGLGIARRRQDRPRRVGRGHGVGQRVQLRGGEPGGDGRGAAEQSHELTGSGASPLLRPGQEVADRHSGRRAVAMVKLDHHLEVVPTPAEVLSQLIV